MKNKDREIGNLNTRIEEIKGQSERDRMILLDVGFHKSKLRENTILSPEKNKSKIENQQNEENKEKIIQNTPVVMVGFFDSEDIFHKTRLIQNSSDLKIDKNSAEELTKLIKYCNKETLTETGDSICMKKSNKFQQFPEIKSFVISHEDSSSIKIFPSKRKYGSLPDNNLNSINLVIPKIEKRKKKSMKRAKSIDLLNIEKNVVNDRRKLSVENKLESSDNDKKSEKSMEKSITEYSISSDKNSSARSSKKIKYRIIENILKEPVTENNSIDKSRGKKADRKKLRTRDKKKWIIILCKSLRLTFQQLIKSIHLPFLVLSGFDNEITNTLMTRGVCTLVFTVTLKSRAQINHWTDSLQEKTGSFKD